MTRKKAQGKGRAARPRTRMMLINAALENKERQFHFCDRPASEQPWETPNGTPFEVPPGWLTDEPKDWVLFSALLDIWQDEEIPHSVTEQCRLIHWTHSIQRIAPDFFEWLPHVADLEDKKDKKTSSTHHFDDVNSLRCSLNSTGQDALLFLHVKRMRITANLSYNLACSKADPGSLNIHVLNEKRKLRKECLEQVFLLCATALSHLEVWNKAGPKDSGDITRATLIALWHSELCASAPDRANRGLARMIEVPDKAVQRKLFRKIQDHNDARACNHLGQHSEATKILEELVSDVQTGTSTLPDRLVVLPAIATMGDALSHLHRQSESCWFYELGQQLALGLKSRFWEMHFEFSMTAIRGKNTSAVSAQSPRLEHHRMESDRTCIETLWQRSPTPIDDYNRKDWLENWIGSLGKTLTWHAAELLSLLKAVDTLSREIRELSGERKSRWKKHNAYASRNNTETQPEALEQEAKALQDGLCAIYRLLLLAGYYGDHRMLRFLCGDPLENQPSAQGWRLLWKTVWELLQALNAVDLFCKCSNGTPLNSKLDSWREKLRKRLFENEEKIRNSATICLLEALTEGYQIEGCKIKIDPEINDPDITVNDACPAAGCAVESLFNDRFKSSSDGLAGVPYYLSTMATRSAQFAMYLDGRTVSRKRVAPDFEFISLRRWNSFSPNLGSLASETVGGGYLIRIWHHPDGKNGQENPMGYFVGIAIDPGYNFLENLFNEGFTIGDLDVVVVTHTHPDHTDNLSNLLTLLRETKKRGSGATKRIWLVVSEGVHQRYIEHFDNEAEFIEDVVVLAWKDCPGNIASKQPLFICASDNGEAEVDLQLGKQDRRATIAQIKSIPAYHDDGSRRDSMGVRISVGKDLAIGVISDSRYHKGLSTKLKNCNLVVAHLGAVLNQKNYMGADLPDADEDILMHLGGKDHSCEIEQTECARKNLYELLRTENHLFLSGTAKLICELISQNTRPPMIVLSEFGEEMRGGLRADLARRLEQHFRNLKGCSLPGIIPADVGLRIDVKKRLVQCAICNRYLSWDKLKAMTLRPEDEAMLYVCSDCRNLRPLELPELLRQRRMVPRPLEKIENIPSDDKEKRESK